jgi:lipoprotein-releasing system permease protein
MYEFDLNMAIISLGEAQDFFGYRNKINNIWIKVRDPYKADIIGEKVKKLLGRDYLVQDWKGVNGSLLEALELEKFAMFIILTMIVLVGALNIISTLVMIVMEKTRDVAMLRAMGAAKKSIMSVFILQGLIVGIIGTLSGLLSGLGICYLLSKYKIIELPDIYDMATLPVSVEVLDVLLVVFASLVISFLATIYPSWHASRLNPVEALRYE